MRPSPIPKLLYCVGQALADQGVGDNALAVLEPTGLGVANLLGKVGAAVWKEYRADGKQDKLHADILEAAKLSFADARAEAAGVGAAVAGGDPELAGQVERFVTQVPASIRASLRRADDPTGTTLPAGYAVRDADDVVRLLPPRLPRFKAGDAPEFLNGWELVEQLGAGGFGEVWKARNAEDHSLVGAVKFGHALSDAEQALLNEGDVLNRLRAAGGHPGVVELHDRRTRGGAVPWQRYEYVPGGDLCGLILQWQGLPPAERLAKGLAALRELAATVGHFHRLPGGPVVHRDLKPSNILVAADGRLKVADFGIGAVSASRSIEAERRGTQSRNLVLQSYLRGSHTPLYASPQQRAGSRAIDPRDDVHALGVIAYQMLTGRLDQGGPVRTSPKTCESSGCGSGRLVGTALSRPDAGRPPAVPPLLRHPHRPQRPHPLGGAERPRPGVRPAVRGRPPQPAGAGRGHGGRRADAGRAAEPAGHRPHHRPAPLLAPGGRQRPVPGADPGHPGAAEQKAGGLATEADELWSLVGRKGRACRVWAALDRGARPVVAMAAGDRSAGTAQRLWAALPAADRDRAVAGTDVRDAYLAAVPNERHARAGEGGLTDHVERSWCTLRQRCRRCVRRTPSLSKCPRDHLGAVWYFIRRYNRSRRCRPQGHYRPRQSTLSAPEWPRCRSAM